MSYRKRKLWLRKQQAVLRNSLFFLLLFFVITIIWWGGTMLFQIIFTHETWEDVFPDTAIDVVSFSFSSQKSLSQQEASLQKDLQDSVLQKIQSHLQYSDIEIPVSTHPERIVWATLPNAHWVFALEYDETIPLESLQSDTVFDFSQSQPLFFMRQKDWFFFSSTEDIFDSRNSLAHFFLYKQWKKNVSKGDFTWYRNIKAWVSNQNYNQHELYEPLRQTLADIFPVFGLSGHVKESGMDMNFFVSSSFDIDIPTRVYQNYHTAVGKNALFFWHGAGLGNVLETIKEQVEKTNIHAAQLLDFYWNTKKNQFGIDIESIVTSFLKNEYAVWLDIDHASNDFMAMFFNADPQFFESRSVLWHEWQSFLSPELEIVDLPNGDVRQSLVKSSLDDILFETQIFQNQTYTQAPETIIQKGQIGWFSNSYFSGLSTHASLLSQSLHSLSSPQDQLSSHTDVQDSIQGFWLKNWGVTHVSHWSFIPDHYREKVFQTSFQKQIESHIKTHFRSVLFRFVPKSKVFQLRTKFVFR